MEVQPFHFDVRRQLCVERFVDVKLSPFIESAVCSCVRVTVSTIRRCAVNHVTGAELCGVLVLLPRRRCMQASYNGGKVPEGPMVLYTVGVVFCRCVGHSEL